MEAKQSVCVDSCHGWPKSLEDWSKQQPCYTMEAAPRGCCDRLPNRARASCDGPLFLGGFIITVQDVSPKKIMQKNTTLTLLL